MRISSSDWIDLWVMRWIWRGWLLISISSVDKSMLIWLKVHWNLVDKDIYVAFLKSLQQKDRSFSIYLETKRLIKKYKCDRSFIHRRLFN
jgi:hypothetical protein